MISSNGYAFNNPSINESKKTLENIVFDAQIQYSYGNKTFFTNKKFTSQSEMESFIDSEIEKMQVKFKTVDELTCSVTIRVGTSSNYIEATVTGPCSQIAAAAAKLKKELMALL